MVWVGRYMVLPSHTITVGMSGSNPASASFAGRSTSR